MPRTKRQIHRQGYLYCRIPHLLSLSYLYLLYSPFSSIFRLLGPYPIYKLLQNGWLYYLRHIFIHMLDNLQSPYVIFCTAEPVFLSRSFVLIAFVFSVPIYFCNVSLASSISARSSICPDSVGNSCNVNALEIHFWIKYSLSIVWIMCSFQYSFIIVASKFKVVWCFQRRITYATVLALFWLRV